MSKFLAFNVTAWGQNEKSASRLKNPTTILLYKKVKVDRVPCDASFEHHLFFISVVGLELGQFSQHQDLQFSGHGSVSVFVQGFLQGEGEN